MQINWLSSIFLHVSNLLPSYLLSGVLFCLPFQLASHSDLNTRPERTEPEGESSPLESDQPQRMESAETKDVEQRLSSHTKPDAVPLSPVSPALSVPRSRRKEGKGVVDWIALVYFKATFVRYETVPVVCRCSLLEVGQLSGGKVIFLVSG